MDIKELQDKVYELEGLIELYLQRDDKRNVLLELIKGKIRQVSAFDAKDPDALVPKGMTNEDVEEYPDEEPYQEEDTFGEEEEFEAPAAPAPAVVSAAAPAKASGRGKPKFCINDRFRFRRELFWNSSEAFDSAMEKVSRMNSYDEAETYLKSTYSLNPDNETVVEFLDIIRQYFDGTQA